MLRISYANVKSVTNVGYRPENRGNRALGSAAKDAIALPESGLKERPRTKNRVLAERSEV
jgi:hypothetical protein